MFARRLVVAAVALACGLALPVISDDVWAYAAYGALVGHGADPWAHAYGAAAIGPLRDPLLDAALRAWDGSLPRDVYGPLFTLPCALVVGAARPLGPAGTILVLRVLAAAALLACIALCGASSAGAKPWRPRLAALLSFHPVVLWAAAEGHNDVFWLALVLAATRPRPRIASLSRPDSAVSAAAASPATGQIIAHDVRTSAEPARLLGLIAATAVKLVAVVPLIAELARTPRRSRLAATVCAFAALALAYAPLLRSVIANGLDHGSGAPRTSLAHALALTTWSHSPVPFALGIVLALAGIAAVARALRSGDALAGAGLAGWLLLPAPEPWYALWLVPVVALAGRTPASLALLTASFTGAAGYLQDAVAGTALRDPALLGGIMLALYAVPLLVALAAPAPSPLPQPGPTAAPAAPASPAPSPAATTTPVPPSPSPQPSTSPNPFSYVVDPTPGPSGAPRIVQIALNDRVLHKGGPLVVRVTTSADVTTVVARTMGREIGIPQGGPGYFSGQDQLPSSIPFFLLNRTYQIEFVASTGDGRTTSYTVPVRLER
ncbi:MAG TPA: hypothetical protein VHS78_07640 [Candidatus Elarobacter sp.]|nr:hypothetical protein [Candidatus Elarobacter sp.]